MDQMGQQVYTHPHGPQSSFVASLPTLRATTGRIFVSQANCLEITHLFSLMGAQQLLEPLLDENKPGVPGPHVNHMNE